MKAKFIPVVLDKSIKAPKPKLTKEMHDLVHRPVVPRAFKEIWPRILAYIIEHPDKSYRDVWRVFHKKIDDIHSYDEFKAKLVANGLSKKRIKQDTSIAAQVDVAIQTFADAKKGYAEQHMKRIHNKLEQIHETVESISVTEDNVGKVLGLVSKLHEEGRLAYGIDDEARGDQKVTNLAVMIGFDPTPKPKVIEAQVS